MKPILYEMRAVVDTGKGRIAACTTGNQFRDVSTDLTKYAQAPIRDTKLAHRRVIRLVIRILTEVGWTQGTCYRDIYGDALDLCLHGGPPLATYFCLVGAMDTAMGLMEKRYDVQYMADNVCKAIYAALDKRYGQGEAWSRVTWNDNLYRTPEQVVSILNAALRINL